MNPMEKNRNDPALADRAGAVGYAYDLSGNVALLNHERQQAPGYSREEACGMDIAEVTNRSLSDHIRAQILREANDCVGTVYEIDIVAKDGRCIPLEVSTQVVLRDGVPVEVQWIAVPSVIRNHSSFSTGLRPQDFNGKFA